MTEKAFASFRSELLRPLVTLAIPGAIGSAPWVVLIVENQPSLKILLKANHTEAMIAFVLVAFFGGLIFQDLGAALEDHWDHEMGEKHLTAWYEYLCTPTSPELVAHRYLSDLVMALKFELGQTFACLFSIVGLLIVHFVRLCNGGFDYHTFVWSLLISLLLIVLGVYLLSQAKTSHGVLSKLRDEMQSRRKCEESQTECFIFCRKPVVK